MANAFNVLSYGNYALFVVLAFLIIISSYIISHMVNAIERRTKYSGVLVAGTIVALISSLPEFTSSLVGIFTTHNPAVASGNLMGGNLFRTCMLAFTLLFFIPSIKYARTTVIQVSLILSQIGVFACYLIIIVLGNNIGDGHVETDVFHNIIFGVFSGLVVCLYIFNLWIMYRNGKKHTEILVKELADDKYKGIQAKFINYFNKIAIRKIVILFVICALTIIASAFCIAICTDWILFQGFGWNDAGFGYAILLGIVTSIPEIVTVVSLLRLRNVSAAISDILGSTLFSCLILAVVDLVYWHPGSTFFGPPGALEFAALSFTTLIALICFGGVLIVNYLWQDKNKGLLYYSLNITLLVLCAGVYVIYVIGSIEKWFNFMLPAQMQSAITNNVMISFDTIFKRINF